MATATETELIVSDDAGSRDNRRIAGDETEFSPTHPNEDDVSSKSVGDWKLFAVLDGHDGPHAVAYFKTHLLETLSRKIEGSPDQNVSEQLIITAFKESDDEFFNSLSGDIANRGVVVSKLQGLNSYEAYLQFPAEVQQIQEIDQRIGGGTTSAVVMVNKKTKTLWAANVGDSRVLLFETAGTHQQLTVDHTTSNKDELDRLAGLGLNREALAENGRLGSCENTRSLGDFCLKQGYKEVDLLQQASSHPGIATPHVKGPVSFKPQDFVVLMTDGVYNIAEHVLDGKYPANLRDLIISKDYKPQTVLDEVGQIACQVYKENVGKQNEDCRRKVNMTRKQDDMTLQIIRFLQETQC